MNDTTPDVRETCDHIITVIDGMVGDLTELLYTVRSIRLEADAAARDSTPSRYCTPLGDRLERSVPCSVCRRPTFALDATCDVCVDKAQGYADDFRSDGAA